MHRLALIASVAGSLVVLTAGGRAVAQDRPGAERSAATLRQWSEQIAYTYLQRWSSGDGRALADVSGLYGPRVSFHGEFIDQRNLFAQKRRFARRWPIRRYEHRPGTMRITCDNAKQACLVRSIIDWQAASPSRGAFARGASTFELGIGFSGPRPAVLFERGHVIRNGRHAAEG